MSSILLRSPFAFSCSSFIVVVDIALVVVQVGGLAGERQHCPSKLLLQRPCELSSEQSQCNHNLQLLHLTDHCFFSSVLFLQTVQSQARFGPRLVSMPATMNSIWSREADISCSMTKKGGV